MTSIAANRVSQSMLQSLLVTRSVFWEQSPSAVRARIRHVTHRHDHIGSASKKALCLVLHNIPFVFRWLASPAVSCVPCASTSVVWAVRARAALYACIEDHPFSYAWASAPSRKMFHPPRTQSTAKRSRTHRLRAFAASRRARLSSTLSETELLVWNPSHSRTRMSIRNIDMWKKISMDPGEGGSAASDPSIETFVAPQSRCSSESRSSMKKRTIGWIREDRSHP